MLHFVKKLLIEHLFVLGKQALCCFKFRVLTMHTCYSELHSLCESVSPCPQNFPSNISAAWGFAVIEVILCTRSLLRGTTSVILMSLAITLWGRLAHHHMQINARVDWLNVSGYI